MTSSNLPVTARARDGETLVVASHRLACQAAATLLEAGGTLADAAIAGGAALTVACQSATSLAGDAIMLVRDGRDGAVHCLNATGRAPAALDSAAFANGMLWRGARTVTSPGLVAGWQALHDRFGRLPWHVLFEPALALAREGFTVSDYLAHEIAFYADVLAADPGARALFLPNGKPRRAGEVIVQPALATSMAELVQGGSRAFYLGQAAEGIASTVQEQGGWLTKSDFLNCAPLWQTPLATTYRGVEVLAPPPNSYGLALLLQLAVLEGERFDGDGLQSPERFLKLVRAARAAFCAGEPHIADPAHAYPVDDALSEAGLAKVRALYRAQIEGDPWPPAGGTATLSLLNAQGDAVIVVQSVMQEFGSGVVCPRSGILLNNRISGFSARPGRPNSIAPGKKAAHSLVPTLVQHNGTPRLLIATPGGSGQTVTLAQVISGLIDGRNGLAETIAAPRWSVGREGRLMAEATMPDAVLAVLKEQGAPLERVTSHVPYFGSVEAIERNPEGLCLGVADARREAFTLGCASGAAFSWRSPRTSPPRQGGAPA